MLIFAVKWKISLPRCYTSFTLLVLHCSKCSKIGWALHLIRSPLSTANINYLWVFCKIPFVIRALSIFPARPPLFRPQLHCGLFSGQGGNEDSDIEQLFLRPTFCSLLTGLVRLAHLVLDQGRGWGERNDNEEKWLCMIWERCETMKRLWRIFSMICPGMFFALSIKENYCEQNKNIFIDATRSSLVGDAPKLRN